MSKGTAVLVAAIVSLVIGLGSIVGGFTGIAYTYNQAVEQNITTGDDAAIANAPVRGPWTMKAQADNIEKHTLARTDGKYYAEMSRDDETRPMWITATSLTTALSVGIMAYAVSLFALVVGCVFITNGVVFLCLRN